MTTKMLSATQVTEVAIAMLCRELGPANTARFLNQISGGFGNFTEERQASQTTDTVESLVKEIKRRRKKIPHS